MTCIYVTTWELSKKFDIQHRMIKMMIRKFKKDFESLGELTTPVTIVNPKQKGRRIELIYLNEKQSIFLALLCVNNEKINKFKLELTKNIQRSFL